MKSLNLHTIIIGRKIYFTMLFICCCATAIAQSTLKVYPSPKEIVLNTDFTVKVKVNNKKWQEVPTYAIKVNQLNGFKQEVQTASMAYFDFDGEVEVAVTYNKGAIDTARIRPLSYQIFSQTDKNTIYFKLTKPSNLSVEINGDLFHNLHLFANPIEKEIPSPKAGGVMYFEPGVHDIANKELKVPSNTTVYVAGGAVINGQILIKDVKNVKVMGRGMVNQDIRGGIHIAHSENVYIEGLFASQCFTGGSNHVTIKNVKSISYFKWGDGMNVISSNDVLIDGTFHRNSDDCTTVYGTRSGYVGGCNNITMQNATLWADIAHPILIGTHGNTPEPDMLQNLMYKNIDILDHEEKQLDYQGCMSINAGDSNLVKNVTFENIRVEDFRHGQLFNIRVFYNSKYCTSPGRGIEDVLFKDITYNGSNAEPSFIAGYDESHQVKNITFENLTINGVQIYDDMPNKPGYYKTSDIARIFVGEHVEHIVFKK